MLKSAFGEGGAFLIMLHARRHSRKASWSKTNQKPATQLVLTNLLVVGIGGLSEILRKTEGRQRTS